MDNYETFSDSEFEIESEIDEMDLFIHQESEFITDIYFQLIELNFLNKMKSSFTLLDFIINPEEIIISTHFNLKYFDIFTQKYQEEIINSFKLLYKYKEITLEMCKKFFYINY